MLVVVSSVEQIQYFRGIVTAMSIGTQLAMSYSPTPFEGETRLAVGRLGLNSNLETKPSRSE